MLKGLVAGLVLLTSGSAWADWKLDNDYSRVSFVSVKKDKIGEAHHFTQLSGSISDSGKLNIEISLASVETMIPIRNERMQKLMFETKMFPQADITGMVDKMNLKMKNGDSKIVTMDIDVGLHGVNKLVNTQVMVTRVSNKKMMVASFKPIILTPADFGLDKGIMKLQAVAKLPSITQSVPVSFVLTFNLK